jgi:hypothetical protein
LRRHKKKKCESKLAKQQDDISKKRKYGTIEVEKHIFVEDKNQFAEILEAKKEANFRIFIIRLNYTNNNNKILNTNL